MRLIQNDPERVNIDRDFFYALRFRRVASGNRGGNSAPDRAFFLRHPRMMTRARSRCRDRQAREDLADSADRRPELSRIAANFAADIRVEGGADPGSRRLDPGVTPSAHFFSAAPVPAATSRPALEPANDPAWLAAEAGRRSTATSPPEYATPR